MVVLKNLLVVVILLVSLAFFVTGCDSDKYTYEDVKYDIAFEDKGKDGLRSRYYHAYIFSKEDNTFLHCSHSTAGKGRTIKKYGKWKGDLESKITLVYDDNPKSKESVSIEGDAMYLNNKTYLKTSAKLAILDSCD